MTVGELRKGETAPVSAPAGNDNYLQGSLTVTRFTGAKQTQAHSSHSKCTPQPPRGLTPIHLAPCPLPAGNDNYLQGSLTVTRFTGAKQTQAHSSHSKCRPPPSIRPCPRRVHLPALSPLPDPPIGVPPSGPVPSPSRE